MFTIVKTEEEQEESKHSHQVLRSITDLDTFVPTVRVGFGDFSIFKWVTIITPR